MKISRYDGSECRLILAGMITDQTVCARIGAIKKNGDPLFEHPWADMIAQWCINHMKEYNEPPSGMIEQIFEEWASTTTADKDMVRLVEKFLQFMSSEYEAGNSRSSNYILDRAGRYFDQVRCRRDLEECQEQVERGNLEEAHRMIAAIKPIELGAGSTITLDKEFEPWRNARDRTGRGLVTYPGKAGEFFGDSLSRDSLYAFMGVDKSGKSFWLLDLAVLAIRQRRHVAFFEAGDMGEEDTIIRLSQRLTSRPERETTVKYPTGFDDDAEVIVEKRLLEETSVSEAFKKLQKYTQGKGKWKLSCHPNSSLSVENISNRLKDWAREKWVPDVVIIDYADILAPPSGYRDTLDQIDETWKQLRRLSQEFHCLVVTATQTNAAAYGNDSVLTRRHFSGRKTKLAHVNGMIGLNVSPKDKEDGITRLNWIVKRRGYWSEFKQLRASGCLAVGRPLIHSTWSFPKKTDSDSKDNS